MVSADRLNYLTCERISGGMVVHGIVVPVMVSKELVPMSSGKEAPVPVSAELSGIVVTVTVSNTCIHINIHT